MEKKLLTIAMMLLLSLSVLAVFRIGVAKTEVNLTMSYAELSTQFTLDWTGVGALTSVTGVSDLGVEFNLTGLSSSSGTGVGNNFPVSSLAGGGLDDHGHYGNFSTYTTYRLVFKNQGTNDVQVQLFMNTGYTGSGEPNNWENGNYVTVPAGQTEVVTMDLSSVPYLYHVSNIGFQVLGSGDGKASLVVYSSANLYIDPMTVEMHINSTTPVGTTFEMTVKVENVTDLYGMDIRITWDDALISFDHESHVGLLSTIWGPVVGQNWTVLTNESGVGYYRFIAVSLNNSFTGSNGLFTVGFKINDPNTNSMKQTSIHFDIQKLSDKASQAIAHDAEDGMYEVWGKTPILSMTHLGVNSRTCRETNEPFTVRIDIANAANITDFNFEIIYDSAMLDYVSSTVPWGTGTITEGPSGTLIGTTHSVTGAQSGSIELVTISFKSDPTFVQKWKDPSTGQLSNLFLSSIGIYVQSATLKYPSSQPNLTYVRGGTHEINPPTDFSYTFYPIKGDLNNDGTVDISDLTTVAHEYDTTNPLVNLIGSDNYIDIFDLVVVASNFWFTYAPPSAGP